MSLDGHNSSFKAQLKNFKMAKFMDGRVPGVTLVENEEERLYFQEKVSYFLIKGKLKFFYIIILQILIEKVFHF